MSMLHGPVIFRWLNVRKVVHAAVLVVVVMVVAAVVVVVVCY